MARARQHRESVAVFGRDPIAAGNLRRRARRRSSSSEIGPDPLPSSHSVGVARRPSPSRQCWILPSKSCSDVAKRSPMYAPPSMTATVPAITAADATTMPCSRKRESASAARPIGFARRPRESRAATTTMAVSALRGIAAPVTRDVGRRRKRATERPRTRRCRIAGRSLRTVCDSAAPAARLAAMRSRVHDDTAPCPTSGSPRQCRRAPARCRRPPPSTHCDQRRAARARPTKTCSDTRQHAEHGQQRPVSARAKHEKARNATAAMAMPRL